MAHKYGVEIVDRSLRDIIRTALPFGAGSSYSVETFAKSFLLYISDRGVRF